MIARFRASAVAALCAVSALLAGCDQGVFVNRNPTPSAFSGYDNIQQVAANGRNQIVVYNSPFPPDATINSILAAAQKRYASNQYRFFAGPPTPDWNGYTVLLAFSDGVTGNRNLCQNRQQPLRPMTGGWTTIFAEYCLGDILVTEATAYTRPVNGPDDPRFTKLVEAALGGLFEYWVPNRTGAAPRN